MARGINENNNNGVAGSSSFFSGVGEKFWKKLWNASALGKVKICAWRACLDSLPTRVNLSKRRVMGEEVCVVYGVQVESTEQIVVWQGQCGFEVWD